MLPCLRTRYGLEGCTMHHPDRWDRDTATLRYWGYTLISMGPGFVLSSADGTTVSFATDAAAIHFLNILTTAKAAGLHFDPDSMEADNDS